MKLLPAVLVVSICAMSIVAPRSTDASGWVQPIQYDNVGCCHFMLGTGSCASFCATHVGIDWMVGAAGRSVYAIGIGYDVNYFPSAASFGGCGVAGGALWIKHRKSNGAYFWALYGHIRNPVYTLLGAGQTIAAGAKVCEVANYDPCCPSGANCPHLHFGIWDGGTRPATDWGYGTQRSFTDPVAFLSNTSPDTPPYQCAWVANSAPVWAAPGQTLSGLSVQFTNDGTDYWQDARNVTNAHNVELRTCDGAGNTALPWLIPMPPPWRLSLISRHTQPMQQVAYRSS